MALVACNASALNRLNMSAMETAPEKPIPDADKAFHTYGLEWTPTNLTFSVDNQVYYSVTKDPSYDFRRWPYDQRYHLVVNLALGGSWAGDEKAAYPPYGVDDSKLPSSLQLQSIKYFPFVQK